ncbi:MAG: thioredoxin domain-containing protein, partial [Alphaproteobacteria bacterium]|nr:thioredoxin domain-containing protein [Alphaproteobacteria bacterium]
MTLTRRYLLKTSAWLVLAAAAVSHGPLPRFVAPALADTPEPDKAELAKAGPDGDVGIGAENAPVTVIEYASMTCPHCARFHANTYPTLKSKYIDTGKVRFILREFPLDQFAAAGFML